jgi:hypothetical protein
LVVAHSLEQRFSNFLYVVIPIIVKRLKLAFRKKGTWKFSKLIVCICNITFVCVICTSLLCAHSRYVWHLQRAFCNWNGENYEWGLLIGFVSCFGAPTTIWKQST